MSLLRSRETVLSAHWSEMSGGGRNKLKPGRSLLCRNAGENEITWNMDGTGKLSSSGIIWFRKTAAAEDVNVWKNVYFWTLVHIL